MEAAGLNNGSTALNAILQRLHRERGVDFRRFKEGTLQRRVAKRLIKRGLHDYAAYIDLLDRDPGECDALFNDLTINVTDFFRDEIAFTALRLALQARLAGVSGRFRVWCAACATGEEPYSVARLLSEILGGAGRGLELGILATDIDRQALQRAQGGLYPRAALEQMPPDWVERFFLREGDRLRVVRALRELVTFREHNLFDPPPVAEVDLLLCRNVLIYFNRDTVEEVLLGFHRALRPGGLLLIGRSEVPGARAHPLFRCVDFPGRLYESRGMATP